MRRSRKSDKQQTYSKSWKIRTKYKINIMIQNRFIYVRKGRGRGYKKLWMPFTYNIHFTFLNPILETNLPNSVGLQLIRVVPSLLLLNNLTLRGLRYLRLWKWDFDPYPCLFYRAELLYVLLTHLWMWLFKWSVGFCIWHCHSLRHLLCCSGKLSYLSQHFL